MRCLVMPLLLATGLLVAGCTDSRASAEDRPVLGSETTLVTPAEASRGGQGGNDGSSDGSSARNGGDRPVGGDEADVGATARPDDPAEVEGETEFDEATALVFRLVMENLDGVSNDVADFVTDSSDARLSELASSTCDELDPDLTLSELGVATIRGFGELAGAERGRLDLAEYQLLAGALAGFYCPSELPLDVDLSNLGLDDAGVDVFRLALPALLPAGHPAGDFVASLTDGRLEQLQRSACRAIGSGGSISDFGAEVREHYDGELRAAERARIDVDDYEELVVGLLAWFCPGQVGSGIDL